MSCRKNTFIPCTFAISRAHFEHIKVLDLSFFALGFFRKIFPRRLRSVKFSLFKLFLFMIR